MFYAERWFPTLKGSCLYTIFYGPSSLKYLWFTYLATSVLTYPYGSLESAIALDNAESLRHGIYRFI